MLAFGTNHQKQMLTGLEKNWFSLSSWCLQWWKC